MEYKPMIVMLAAAAVAGGALALAGEAVAGRWPRSWLVPVLPILSYVIMGVAALIFWIKWWGSGNTMTFQSTYIIGARPEQHGIVSVQSIFWTLTYSFMYLSIGRALGALVLYVPWIALKALFKALFGRGDKS